MKIEQQSNTSIISGAIPIIGELIVYLLSIWVITNRYSTPIASIKLYEVVLLVLAVFFLFDHMVRETGKAIEDSIEKANDDIVEAIRSMNSDISCKIDEVNDENSN